MRKLTLIGIAAGSAVSVATILIAVYSQFRKKKEHYIPVITGWGSL